MAGWPPPGSSRLLLLLTCAAAAPLAGLAVPGGDGAPDFDRDVRPILSDRCFRCHGPDGAQRQAGLRLDTRDGLFGELRLGGRAVTPGDLEGSELWQRVTSGFEDERMPPPEGGPPLSTADQEVLRRWILAGATWTEHWSFLPPVRPALPDTGDAEWCWNPVDRFLLAAMEAKGVRPAAVAAPEVLVRRLHLDLLGLPPPAAAAGRFAAAPSRKAFLLLVDELLDRPEHAEHLTRWWLDAARYADTHGFHIDAERSLWRWRDWVLEAFAADLPFDRFTIAQMAGDLLPGATLADRIATGFHRNNPTSGEGGLIEEEYLARYAMDRTETTATVWMGLTLGCARCHDHKYDPLSQRDYYRMLAFFGDIAERGSDGNALAPPPVLAAPLPGQAEELAALDERLEEARKAFTRLRATRRPEALRMAEQEARRLGLRGWSARPAFPTGSGGLHLGFDLTAAAGDGGPPGAFAGEGAPGFAPGRRGTALVLDGRSWVDLGDRGGFDAGQPFSWGAWVCPDDLGAMTVLARMDDGQDYRGWDLYLAGGRVFAHLIHRWEEDAIRVRSEPVLEAGQWHHILATWDGGGRAAGLRLYLDGRPLPATATHDRLTGSIRTERSLHAGARSPAAPLRGRLDELVLVPRVLSPEEVAALAAVDAGPGVELPGSALPTVAEPWSIAGPFPAATSPPPPLDERAAGGLEWTWRPDLVDGRVHGLPAAENASLWLRRTLEVPSPRVATFHIGSDDGFRLWVDGAPAAAFTGLRGAAMDQDSVAVGLPAGRHELLLQVDNAGGAYAFAFRFEEQVEGLPLAEIQALAAPAGDRNEAQEDLLLDAWIARHSPIGRSLRAELARLEGRRRELDAAIPRTMVLARAGEPRPVHLLRRGRYDQPGELVQPGVPAVLPPLPAGTRADRLALARWLVSPENPLTARVIVNRLWALVFGRGLVPTVEDFGSQGARPSHPELLDWLAVEFRESGWDVDHVLRLLVTSHAWALTAACPPAVRARDPDNLLLARAPRYRLDAEVIRDSALAASGLLVRRMGGPSVRPWQPPGLWKEVAYGSESNAPAYVPDTGEGQWRRSLYTFWKRTAPPPTMTLLDAPTRESCTVRRSRTDTPLQALALLNDRQFVEAARVLAQRVLAEAPPGEDGRLDFLFLLCLARSPRPAEARTLRALLEVERRRFRADPAAATALLEVGETPSSDADPAESAAWTLLASTLLNLDEFLTRG